MSESKPDIEVSVDTWKDLNTTAGVLVGSPFTVSNKGVHEIYLYEGDVMPANDSVTGEVLTTTKGNYAHATIEADSLKIWVRSSVLTSLLSVQEV